MQDLSFFILNDSSGMCYIPGWIVLEDQLTREITSIIKREMYDGYDDEYDEENA